MSAVAYLVVANPSSKNNLGTLIRCAAAFGVEEVVVVGAPKWSTHGAHGSHKVTLFHTKDVSLFCMLLSLPPERMQQACGVCYIPGTRYQVHVFRRAGLLCVNQYGRKYKGFYKCRKVLQAPLYLRSL